MKSRDLFCASHASTAICSSMDQRRVVRPKTRPSPAGGAAPCASQLLPFDPISKKNSTSRDSVFLENLLADNSSKDNAHALVPYRPPRKTPAAVVAPPPPPRPAAADQSPVVKSSSAPSGNSNHQVVELRVSIHCKGCEGKVRKHLSKMEGVTSFSIDLDSKKVTVIGNVTPLGVLANISKVKNAQFWPSPATSPRVSLSIT